VSSDLMLERATLARKGIPVLCGAAFKNKYASPKSHLHVVLIPLFSP